MDFQPPYFPPPFSSSAVSSAGVGPNAAEVFSSHLQSDHYQHYAVSKHYSSHLKQIWSPINVPFHEVHLKQDIFSMTISFA